MDNLTENQTRFNHAAPTWDENPGRLLMANNIAAAIRARVPIDPSMTVLDFGCGTGLVSLALQPYVKRVIGIDCSTGMLAVLAEKVRVLGLTNVDTHCLDLSTHPAPDLHADVIVSAMALHHIADIPAILRVLVQRLTPGGYLALADLDSEDGSFHEDKSGVYHAGIDRAWLLAQLQALDLQQLSATTAHVMERPSPAGTRHYPIFLISGQKPA
jgi:2-polyprenyl-3-methyl-5-hydroxy-6-metoxy-1,4-benzoquinol methylase